MDSDDQLPSTASLSNGSPIKPNDVHVMLAKAIHRHKNVIINPSSSIPREKISLEKEKAWESVRLDMVNAGIQRFSNRTWRTVRDVDWQHLRRRVVNKIAENLKIYQTANKDLNELDILVLDTLGKTNSDGSIDFSDLIKTEPVDEMPKSVNSDKSDNNYDQIDNSLVASTTNFLAEIIEEYGSNLNGKTAKRNHSPLPSDCLKKKNCPAEVYQSNNPIPESKTVNLNDVNLFDHSLLTNSETRTQWETLLRELGIGRNPKEEDGIKEVDQIYSMRVEQEKYRTEQERHKAQQELYKSMQERWKSDLEKLKLEEAKIRLNRLKRD